MGDGFKFTNDYDETFGSGIESLFTLFEVFVLVINAGISLPRL